MSGIKILTGGLLLSGLLAANLAAAATSGVDSRVDAPVVTILFSGRPLILDAVLADSDAFVAAWLPGTEGWGVTDVLFGDDKFTGKLPRTWPHSNHPIVSTGKLEKPLFPFGFGLQD